MDRKTERDFLKYVGSRILSEANYLKRTSESLAAELSMPLDEVRAVINGQAGLDAALGLARRMADNYPIALKDVWIEHDDTDQGVRIMRAADSAKTVADFTAWEFIWRAVALL